MAEDSLNVFKRNNTTLVKSIDVTDTNIDRFTDYCLRVLNKKGYNNFKKTSTIYSIILLLECVGDEYKKASHYLMKNKKVDQSFVSILADVNNLLSIFYSLFYTFERERTLEIYEKTEKLNKKIETSKLSKDEIEILHHLKKIIRFITDLMQLRIDLEI